MHPPRLNLRSFGDFISQKCLLLLLFSIKTYRQNVIEFASALVLLACVAALPAVTAVEMLNIARVEAIVSVLYGIQDAFLEPYASRNLIRWFD